MRENGLPQSRFIPRYQECLPYGICKAGYLLHHRHDRAQHSLSGITVFPRGEERLTNGCYDLDYGIEQVHQGLQHLFSDVVLLPRRPKGICNSAYDAKDGLKQELQVIQCCYARAIRPNTHERLANCRNHAFQGFQRGFR